MAGALALAGCGDDDAQTIIDASAAAPALTLTEIESELDRPPLALVRTGAGPDAADGVENLVDSVRYEDVSGREFDVFVFREAKDAAAAAPLLVDELAGREGAAVAANAVATFSEPYGEDAVFRAASNAMRRLRVACVAPDEAEPRLRGICAPTEEG